eukprot:365297-Chlamydomonas_euryale.AAC.7
MVAGLPHRTSADCGLADACKHVTGGRGADAVVAAEHAVVRVRDRREDGEEAARQLGSRPGRVQ